MYCAIGPSTPMGHISIMRALLCVCVQQLETALKEFFQLREMEVPSSEER